MAAGQGEAEVAEYCAAAGVGDGQVLNRQALTVLLVTVRCLVGGARWLGCINNVLGGPQRGYPVF